LELTLKVLRLLDSEYISYPDGDIELGSAATPPIELIKYGSAYLFSIGFLLVLLWSVEKG